MARGIAAATEGECGSAAAAAETLLCLAMGVEALGCCCRASVVPMKNPCTSNPLFFAITPCDMWRSRRMFSRVVELKVCLERT